MTTASSKPVVGDLIELATAMKKLGAVQVVCGDFSVTFEPPMHTMPDFAPPPRQRPADADDVDDESRGPHSDPLLAAQLKKRRQQVESELFAASETS